MKIARALLNKCGISIFIILVVVGLIKDNIIVPIMGKIWSWTLMTTPEGFISNANILEALVKSPWIIVSGFVLAMLFALLAMWEVSTAVLGIAYAYRGQNVKMIDLLKLSLVHVRQAVKPSNWLLLLYAIIIMPLANLYYAGELIGAYLLPEYIADFINANLGLVCLYTIVGVLVVYLALRWIYTIPGFVLKDQSFREARIESKTLTSKVWLKDGVKLGIYELIECLRLVIIPLLMVTVACIVCLVATWEMTYAVDVMASVGIAIGYPLVGAIVSKLVYISIICYVLHQYISKLEAAGMDTNFKLPELTRQSKQHRSVTFVEIWVGLLIAAVVSVSYLGTVYLAENYEEVPEALFHKSEILAHKGYSSEAPENTNPAFDLANKSKYTDFIELDVWSAKDGVPVVVHNETITAATGLKGNVYDYTSEELRNIPAPYSSDEKQFPNAYIPTLEEVLANYSQTTPILIEIKGYKQDPKLPAKIVALMDKYNCKESCMIHSGNYQALRAVKEIDDSIQCGLILAFVSGECYDLPYADFFSVEHTFVTQAMVNQLHIRGKKLYVWTVNREETAEEMRLLNVDGIITDYPDQMAQETETVSEMIDDVVEENIENLGNLPESTFDDGEY